MLLGQLVTEVLSRLGDLDEQVWSESEILDYANEAIRHVLLESRWLWKRTTLSDVANTTTASLPNDLLEIERVTWDWKLLPRISPQVLMQLDSEWQTRTGDPEAYVVGMDGHNVLRKYPAPAQNGSGDLDTRLDYFATLSDLAGTDTFPLPDRFALAVKLYCLHKALDREGPGQHKQMAAHYFARFAEQLENVRRRAVAVAYQAPRQFGGPERRATRKTILLPQNFPERSRVS